MLILDTNVVSELIRPQPSARVGAWMSKVPPEETYVTAVSIAELWYGVELLPDGGRKQDLSSMLAELLQWFGERVLPFDSVCGAIYASIAARRRKRGRPISQTDAMIAAIAQARAAVLATRDSDFADCGIEVVNPWA